SQASSSEGSNAAAASCSVIARRVLPSESRKRPKNPSRCSSVSSGVSVSPRNSPQLLVAAGGSLCGGSGATAAALRLGSAPAPEVNLRLHRKRANQTTFARNQEPS